MEKIKIGFIGVGHMGHYHVNVVAGLTDTHTIVGVYDKDESNRDKIAKKFKVKAFSNMEDLLKEADAVTIAVPTKSHYEVAKKAFEYDCHVLVEKPITTTIAQAEELVKIAKKKDLKLIVGHVERFNGAVAEISKIIEKPLLVECRRLAPGGGRIKDVGVVFDLMIHDIDIVVQLVNSPLVGLRAYGKGYETEFEDYASVVMEFESGCIANITASRVTQAKIRTLAISQEKNYLLLNYADQDIDIHRQAQSAYLLTKDEIKYSQESFIEKVYIHKDNPLKLQHLHFREVILGEAEQVVSGDSDIEILKIASEIRRQIHSDEIKPDGSLV